MAGPRQYGAAGTGERGAAAGRVRRASPPSLIAVSAGHLRVNRRPIRHTGAMHGEYQVNVPLPSVE
ncbi:hypothetical protein GCM10009609_31430 [Pseudonocardia aurantiaca]